VLLGGGGDLAGRFLLPALAMLHAAGDLPATFRVVGADVHDWDDEAFRAHVHERLERHALQAPLISRGAILAELRYARVDVADPASVARAVAIAGDEPLAAYLALPQRGFAPAIRALTAARLPAGSRIAVEKPFGEDLHSAVELNAMLADATDHAFRVDHVLAMPRTRDVAELDAQGAEEVEILWEETLALEGRAGFYDQAGALRDVLQNHMLQLLALVVAPGDRAAALRATRAPDPLRSRRARYAGYAQEPGVDPARGTETFAEVLLEVDLPGWRDTRFRLRAGKGLAQGYKGVVVHRRGGGEERIEVDRLGEGEPPAYARVLGEVLGGHSSLSVGADEAEEAWRIVTPVLEAWAAGRVALEEYAPGSEGPARL
jgi:glucose-6-phosphate 1-dehydrogenase